MESLLRAVAVAGGRASIEIFHEEVDSELTETKVVAPNVAEARAQGRLILVAEDDPINQKVILRQLVLLGYAAEVASNGQEALRLWRTGEYALLISDLHMPELDGYELTRIIRREEDRRMPILALTANALRGEIHRAMAAGMDEYLTKPVQLEQLASMLEKWMPVKKAALGGTPAVDAKDATSVNTQVDLSVLKNLIGDEPDVLRKLLTDYLVSLRQIASELREAFDAGDAKRVGAVAHKFKSSCRSVGALALGDICAELENAVRAEDSKHIAHHVKHFNEALMTLEKEINGILKGELK